MELFKNTNFDFLGKKWPFIIASLILTVAGLSSIAMKHGLKYGIDFKGGALMRVKFASEPPVDKIRSAMKGDVTVTNIFGGGAVNEVEIGTELADERQLAKNRADMEASLYTAFGQPNSGKTDFNNASQQTVMSALRDPLAGAGVAMSDLQLQDLARNLTSYRDKEAGGLVTNFNQLSSVPGVNSSVLGVLQNQFYLAPFHVLQTEMVGPKVGADLRNKAILATLYALAGMLVYIAFRFEWIYGLGAVIAVFHDTIITIGLFSIFNEEISMTVIAALLTLVGYSMNDTIVIFDRIRENLKLSRREPLDVVMNKAINQTLSRTVMTSGLTFLTVIALFLFGGPVLHAFSFALLCGIIVGTYSSVFIASPIVLFWHNYADQRRSKGGSVASVPAASSPRPEPARKAPTRAAK
jgi:preprotein translocase subunit SecF